jgi:hypothetical protein
MPGFFFAPLISFYSISPAAPFFTNRFFKHMQGFFKTFKEFLQIIGEKNHRLAIKTACRAALALYNVQIKISHAVFFYI